MKKKKESRQKSSLKVGHNPLPLTLQTVLAAKETHDLSALVNLANSAHDADAPDVALAALDALLELKGDDSSVTLKKAQVLLHYGRPLEAVPLLLSCLEKNQQSERVLSLLAASYQALRRDDLAVPLYQRLIRLSPDEPGYWLDLSMTLENIGNHVDAQKALTQALGLDPHNSLAMVLKPVVALERCPTDELTQANSINRAIQACKEVVAWARLHPERLAQARKLKIYGPFAAAYWPGNIIALLKSWRDYNAAIWGEAAAQKINFPAREKIRFGIFSSHFYHQSVFYILLRGLIRLLDRQFFELTLFSNVSRSDALTEWCRQQADHYYDSRPDWVDVIRNEACDILYYPDSTMDPVAVALAKIRNAPLQVTSWGHPVSSAIPALDVFFTGDLLEMRGAENHYTERMIRLPGVGATTPNVALNKQPLPECLGELISLSRQQGRTIVIVPANAFKLCPYDDQLWLTIAQTYPKVLLIFFYQPDLGYKGVCSLERLAKRFEEAKLSLVGLEPHVEFLACCPPEKAVKASAVAIARLPASQFHTLLCEAAVYLDVPSFSGYTTAWQGAFAGIPIVTLEGPFLRQRLASGLLRQIGLTDTIAQDRAQYLEIVGQLLAELQNNPAAHAARRARMQAAAPRACNDERPVRAMERALLEELARRDHPVAQRLLEAHRAKYTGYDYRRDEHRVVAPPPPWAASSAKLSPVGTASATSRTPLLRQESSMNPNDHFAPQPVLGLGATPAASGPPAAQAESPHPTAPAAPLPPWKLLDADLHLATLSHTYAPVGLLEMIPTPPRAVFDLGCFVGGTGRWLKQKFPAVRVVGVELLEKATEKARTVYDEVFTGRFEDFDVEARRGEFDVIVAADVLAHLYHPWAALERLKVLLAPGGSLYVSLPNIRNLRVLEALAAAGEWRYEGAGILDITHIRFFTRQSALRMFAETGWQVLETRANLDAALKPMLQGKNLAQIRNIELPKLVLRNLQGQESVELFTLQWFFRCQPI